MLYIGRYELKYSKILEPLSRNTTYRYRNIFRYKFKFMDQFNESIFKGYESTFFRFPINITSAILWKILWHYSIEKLITLHVLKWLDLSLFYIIIYFYKLLKRIDRERWSRRGFLAEIFDLLYSILFTCESVERSYWTIKRIITNNYYHK